MDEAHPFHGELTAYVATGRQLRLDAPWLACNPRDQYRFTWEELVRVAGSFGLPPVFILSNRVTVPRLQALCMLCYRLSFPRRIVDMAPFFSHAACVISRAVERIGACILHDWGHLLLFDHVRLRPEYLETLAARVQAMGGDVPNCWGFIDCTHIEICRPTDNQDIMYSGHKRMHSMKYQSLCTPDSIIAHMSGPFPGSRHDSVILTLSKLRLYMLTHCKDTKGQEMVIYGDEAYSNLSQVRSPYRGRVLTQAQIRFNSSMRRPRLCVEWGFGFINNRWSWVTHSRYLRMYQSPIGRFYLLCALLANALTCLGRKSTTTSYFGMDPPTLEEYLTPYEQWKEGAMRP